MTKNDISHFCQFSQTFCGKGLVLMKCVEDSYIDDPVISQTLASI